MKVIKSIFIGLFQFIIFIIFLVIISLLIVLLNKVLSSIGLSPIIKAISNSYFGQVLVGLPIVVSAVLSKLVLSLIIKSDCIYLGYRCFSVLVFALGVYGIITLFGKSSIVGDIFYLIVAVIFFKLSFEEKEESEEIDQKDSDEIEQ